MSTTLYREGHKQESSVEESKARDMFLQKPISCPINSAMVHCVPCPLWPLLKSHSTVLTNARVFFRNYREQIILKRFKLQINFFRVCG